MADNAKLLSMIGIARKAGKTIIGWPMISEHISKGKNVLILLAQVRLNHMGTDSLLEQIEWHL